MPKAYESYANKHDESYALSMTNRDALGVLRGNGQVPGLGAQLMPAPTLGVDPKPVDKPPKHSREWWREYRSNRATPTPHGTHNGYVNWGCRCDQCREAHRIHVVEWRATR